MDKFSELKAAALAATPGPWASVDDEWSDGDHANITNEERSDGSIIAIAQVEGGGSESGCDEPFSNEQQANAAFIAAANPAAILALLAELEAKTKHIADMEHVVAAAKCDDELWDAMAHRLKTLEDRLATPVRLPGSFYPDGDSMCREVQWIQR